MSDDPLETRLRQPFRAIPREWRSEILRAAQPMPATLPRELFWPSPLAWAAIAIFWSGLLFSSLDAGDAGGTPLGAAELRQILLTRTDLEFPTAP